MLGRSAGFQPAWGIGTNAAGDKPVLRFVRVSTRLRDSPFFDGNSLVKLSVKSDYAARAVLGLARRYSAGQPVCVETLAEESGISASYLVQILIELKSKNIVKSLRGKEGGYLLARPPAELSLADVIEAVHGQVFDSPALEDPRCPTELSTAWRRLQTALDRAAREITFQSMADASTEKKMYYI